MVIAVATAATVAAATTTKQMALVNSVPNRFRGAGMAAAGGTTAHKGQRQRAVKVAVVKDEASTSVVGDSGTSDKSSEVEDEDKDLQLQVRFVDILSVIFWGIFIRLVFIQGYIIDPAQLRAAAVMEGLGGSVLPVYPQM